MMDTAEIKKIAEAELNEEKQREEIEKIKVKLRNKKSFWHKVMPFKVVIIRR